MTPENINLTTTKTLLATLEDSPESVQLHHGELERLIAKCMDTIFEPSGPVRIPMRWPAWIGPDV